MAKNDKVLTTTQKSQKKMMLAILLAVFGLLLFIALTLTLPKS